MRRLLLSITLILLVVGPVAGDEITADRIISAHRFGAPADSIIQKIRDPANPIAEFTADDFVKLRAAGIPESIIQAVITRSTSPARSTSRPDNAELTEVVRLVQSGLSEPLIVEQVKRANANLDLTSNDLIYLKENKVPESVIAAIIATSASVAAPAPAAGQMSPTPTPAEPEEDDTEFDGLVLTKMSFLKKNRTGTAKLTEDRLLWYDSKDAKENLEIFPAGLKRIKLKCQARVDENFCYEVELVMTKGDNFTFLDVQREMGGNETLMRFCRALRKTFPGVPYKENLD